MADLTNGWAGALILGLFGLGCWQPPDSNTETSPTAAAPSAIGDPSCPDCNLLLISIDTLRPDHLSLYGYERDTDPHLRAMASEGVLFESFHHNGGGTLVSHMSMLTSLRRYAHGVDRDHALPDGVDTLAELLSTAGYRTGAFTDRGWMVRKYGFDQGFETFDSRGGHLEAIVPRALRWLEQDRERPYFLFLHTYDVHSDPGPLPYDCPNPDRDRYRTDGGLLRTTFDGCKDGRCGTELLQWINVEAARGNLDPTQYLSATERRTIRDLYDGCIRYTDGRLGDLRARLEAGGHWKDTLVVITSDHGEEFLEHGQFLHPQAGFKTKEWIPLLMLWPSRWQAGTRVPHLVAMIDLAPSLLEVLSLEPSPQMQGRSFLPALVENRPIRDTVQAGRSLRSERWKYRHFGRQLYDLDADPDERVDVSAQHRRTASDYSSAFRRSVAADRRLKDELWRESRVGNPKLSDEEMEQLRALGYLGGDGEAPTGSQSQR